MMELHPCPGCRRHVAATEPACPFCGGALESHAPVAAGRVGRLSRAAVFAGAAVLGACGSSKAPTKTVDQAAGSGAATTADAGVATVPDAAAAEKQQVETPDDFRRHRDNSGPCCKPYGAPPARRRIV